MASMIRSLARMCSLTRRLLTQGFDDQGRKFDRTGKRAEWWDPKTVENFKSKAQCISDQYSGYTIHGDKKVCICMYVCVCVYISYIYYQ